MTRAKLIALGLGLALIAIFAAPAGAQDGPAITVEPASVDAAGPADIVVSGTGFTAAPPIFVISCAAPESGNLEDLDQETCDTTNLVPATPADGAFEATISVDVPEGGIVIAAFDAGQTETAGVLVTVGAAAQEDGGDDAATEDEGDDAAAEEGGDDAAAEEGGEELANTGVESGLLAVIAIAVLGGGAMAIGYTRRFA